MAVEQGLVDGKDDDVDVYGVCARCACIGSLACALAPSGAELGARSGHVCAFTGAIHAVRLVASSVVCSSFG